MKLYHYTDQDGLLGIVGKKELWATKIQYLNDDNEYKLAFKIAKKYIENKVKHEKCVNKNFRLRRLIANFGSVQNTNICVCSLSEKGDLLSQWRGYSTSLGGYSIGFDKEKLVHKLDQLGFDLKKCIYLPSDQENIIHEAIDMVIEKYSDYVEPYQDKNMESLTSDSAREFCDVLSKISPIIKDQSFSEESEWRVISRNGISFGNLDFRSGKSMLTPYFRIPLKEYINELITEIIVGHSPNIELAKKATEAFIYKEFKDMNRRPHIKISSIPFRKW